MAPSPTDLLMKWLIRDLDEPAADWFKRQMDAVAADTSDKPLHIAMGLAPRRLGRADLNLSPQDLSDADAARPGWDPHEWSVDTAARILLVSRSTSSNEFPARFTDLCRSADAAEAVALYRGLPLYPGPKLLVDQAAEGIRTNMRAIFEAVAYNNPFPREQFEVDRWNQMVLKALFIGSKLHPIQGLDSRANATLARIMIDYAHERWAAGRLVSIELWRCVGPFVEDDTLSNLQRVFESADANDQQAAALALNSSSNAAAQALLNTKPDLAARVRNGSLTWETLSTNL